MDNDIEIIYQSRGIGKRNKKEQRMSENVRFLNYTRFGEAAGSTPASRNCEVGVFNHQSNLEFFPMLVGPAVIEGHFSKNGLSDPIAEGAGKIQDPDNGICKLLLCSRILWDVIRWWVSVAESFQGF